MLDITALSCLASRAPRHQKSANLFLREPKGEDFANATRKKIADNVTEAQVNVLQSRIDDLAALYRDVKPGDQYALTYIPDQGTTLSLNGESLGSIPGDDFAQAVFAIWLGANPIDKKFRDQLLRDS